ncbi:hypothetical protein AAFF_G00237330 [Aldrovandia affinis]|uniref:Uncharacterized protein n=1 Tax=Aldrovandia affinis TaxID=143900 RepID=A0AAD7RE87_9TELE|nr:hypothetical protein AAFF_G00237330 [Aldrovandia affinis]
MLHLSKESASCLTFLTVCAISAGQALRNCGGTQCEEDQRCCAARGNDSAASRCCKPPPLHTFFHNLDWIARKLSGILILLLLFAMGYFIQRIVCPRPRRQGDGQQQAPSATTSQDSLLERSLARHSPGDVTSPAVLCCRRTTR